MNRIEQRKFYASPQWRRASRACRERAGWLCERCAAEGFTEAARVAHHRIPLDEGGPKFEGLEALCRRHHEGLHDRGPSDEQRAWKEYISQQRGTI